MLDEPTYSKSTCSAGSDVKLLKARFCYGNSAESFVELCKFVDFSTLECAKLQFSDKIDEVSSVLDAFPAIPNLKYFQISVNPDFSLDIYRRGRFLSNLSESPNLGRVVVLYFSYLSYLNRFLGYSNDLNHYDNLNPLDDIIGYEPDINKMLLADHSLDSYKVYNVTHYASSDSDSSN